MVHEVDIASLEEAFSFRANLFPRMENAFLFRSDHESEVYNVATHFIKF